MSTLSCMYVVLCKQKPSNWPNPLPRQISTYTIGKLQKEEPCGFADLQGPLNCMEGHGQQKVKHSLFTNFTPQTTEKMITKNRLLIQKWIYQRIPFSNSNTVHETAQIFGSFKNCHISFCKINFVQLQLQLQILWNFMYCEICNISSLSFAAVSQCFVKYLF